MTALVADGLTYHKGDGNCAHPSCPETIDFTKHDKPPTGWATVAYERYTKTGDTDRITLCVCPKHTLNFTNRQPDLPNQHNKLIRTIIESPFAGDVPLNLRYLRSAMHHSLKNGEAPYASHGLYTQEGVLNDADPDERSLGMEAGFKWGEAAHKVVIYTDLGITDGMRRGIERHKAGGKIIEKRRLPGWSRA